MTANWRENCANWRVAKVLNTFFAGFAALPKSQVLFSTSRVSRCIASGSAR